MSEEIVKLLSENFEFYNSVEAISEAYNIFRDRIHTNFKQKLAAGKPNELVAKTIDGYEVKYLIDEDREGFFYGFYVEKEGSHISGYDSNISYITQILKEINPEFKTNDYYVGWVFSKYFRHFLCQDKRTLFDLNSEESINHFTDQIINEIKYYVNTLNKRLCD